MATIQELQAAVNSAQVAYDNGIAANNRLSEQYFSLQRTGQSNTPEAISLRDQRDQQFNTTQSLLLELNQAKSRLENFSAANQTPTPPNASAADAINNDTPPPPATPPVAAVTEPAAGGLSDEEQSRLDQAQSKDSEPVIDPAGSNKKESDPEPRALTANAQGVYQDDPVVVTAARLPPPRFEPLMNPLHEYPSYTYNLSLHMLTGQEFIDLLETQQYQARRVLIASAGRYNNSAGSDQFVRAPRFQEDFYFESLNMETVIQPTERNRNTNALTCDFTIIEPYGFTLIDRLLKTSQDVGSKNYLDMPYLLQIDFFAMNNAGEITGILGNLTKRIPIRMLNMESTITERGAEYHIKAVVYGQAAFGEIYGTTRAGFQVTGSTVGSFFQSDKLTEAQTTRMERQAGDKVVFNQAMNGSISGGRRAGADDFITVDSYAAALNNWQQALKKENKIEYPDVYKFEFDPDIAKAKFVINTLLNHQDTAFTPRESAQRISDQYLSNSGRAKGMLDQERQSFTINAGTAVDRVIDYIVRNSTYILDQLVIPENYKKGADYEAELKANDKPLMWWKIVPKVKLQEFDKIRNTYSKEITYYVKKYKMKNLPLDFGPRGIEHYPAKVYNYIYTGKNVDILDFELKFNMTFYTVATAYRSALVEVNPVPADGEDMKDKNADGYQGGSQGSTTAGTTVAPIQTHPLVADTRSRATGAAVTAEQVAATDLENYVLSRAEGEMIQVDLKILGDPHFIKQDDVFYPPEFTADLNEASDTANTPDVRLTPNGSIRTDDGQIFVNLNFRTPTDINEADGLIKFSDENLTRSSFSGLYRILTVTNHFKDGQFTQQLTLVRASRQQEDEVNQIKTSTEQRSETTTSGNPTVDNVSTGVAATKKSIEPEEGSRPNQNDPGGQDPGPDVPPAADQKDLAEVNATAEEKPITQQTEPVATPPPNESTQAAAARLIYQRGKLADQQISINNELSNLRFRESGVVDRPLTAADRQRLQQLQAQYNALNTQIDAIDAQIKNLRGQ
jgi:hypothetical protein